METKLIPVYWACKDIGNVGDVMSEYIAHKITGQSVKHTPTDKDHYMITGSILTEATSYSTVLGAGLGDPNQGVDSKANIIFVRGPITKFLTEKQLPGKSIRHICDPAVVLPLLYKPRVDTRFKLGIVPHYIDDALVKPAPNVKVISATQPVENFIDEVLSCEFIVSSSLHGLITAHAYQIPAMWVEFSNMVAGGGFKFQDYFQSTSIEYYPPPFLGNKLVKTDIIEDIPRETGSGSFLAAEILEILKRYLV